MRDTVLPAILVELLRRQRVRQQQQFELIGRKWTPNDFVFTTPWGKPIDASALMDGNLAALLQPSGATQRPQG
ncbi:hypothetical protein [Micromonospora sp. CA-246542]|uniref:hypothetical protein n=1 Tax=Micromonospora sp. CA-246542 TaxID=3239959 RepID=UPI003D8E29A6